ncbi:MAG: hypothetical protein ACI9Z3_000461, partial [Roseivirga sp.]
AEITVILASLNFRTCRAVVIPEIPLPIITMCCIAGLIKPKVVLLVAY